MMRRRRAIQALAAACVTEVGAAVAKEKSAGEFEIDYVLASALYGDLPLGEILPEVAKSGSLGLDIWGKPHGTQREELDRLGVDAFAEQLSEHETKCLVSSRYPLGPFGLQAEMPILQRLGGKVLVCGATGPKDPRGDAARSAVKGFLEKIQGHADAAGEHGLTIAIENHSGQILSHPDSIRYFAEFNRHPALGIAFAPHHLHADLGEIPGLIKELGRRNLPFIYFQEYGIGAHKKVEKKVELAQLPGRGTLDYVPILQALRDIDFAGLAEIFMHPTPRGVPILGSASDITGAVNESRKFIDRCLAKSS
ncbi:MAG: sugar phosphate isomerase/epimerase family protein [Verrucomicrobiales bacterium]